MTRFFRVALATALLLAVIPASMARHRAEPVQAGDFDYFLLTLSLAPGFCSLSPANQAKQECTSLTEADFQQTPLTLHGLWPNRTRVSVNLQPHDCDGPPMALSERLRTELRRYMPGGPGLARYEWRKHGTCSGLSPEVYFSAMVHLAAHANETIGAALRDRLSDGTVRTADLLRAVGERDPALASATVVDCRSPRGGGQALIEEIRVVLSRDFQPMPAASVGLGQNSGCPNGMGRVPEVSR